MALTNAKEMIQKAKEGHYAVGHFNLNNLESYRAFLLAAESVKAPIILGVSGGTAKYMGGYRTIADAVRDYIDFLGITVPVALHVDHGTFEQCFEAVRGGFTSIMFDGSKLPFHENLEKTKFIVDLCHTNGITVEAEVGSIGEDKKNGELADIEQCEKIAALGVDFLAAGIGNIHGVYPDNWSGLNFDRLREIRSVTHEIPLVLHGGSGIPEEQIHEAISLGVCKINVNTECQMAFRDALKAYLKEDKDLEGKNYQTRLIMADALEAVQKCCVEKIKLFHSDGKA